MPPVMKYRVTYATDTKRRLIHRMEHEWHVADVAAREDITSFAAYHMGSDGKHYVPDYEAIRAALPHQHRKAFDRIVSWWFPTTLRSAISTTVEPRNACSAQLYDAKGRLLGTVYAAPFLAVEP